jgi:hypothetical protein
VLVNGSVWVTVYTGKSLTKFVCVIVTELDTVVTVVALDVIVSRYVVEDVKVAVD